MSIVQFDSQKIEQLLNSATSERQRKMYQALLDKARSQERSSTANKAPETTPSTEKKTQTTTKGQTKTKTQKKTQTVKKNKKTTPQSATTEASTPTKQSTKTVTESSPLSPTAETPEPATSTTDQAPQTEPKSQSKKQKKQQRDPEAPIFQALGAVIATPYLKDDFIKIVIDGSEYNLLYAQGFRRHVYTRLKEDLEKNGSREMFFRLYPNVKYDYKSQQSKVSFSLVCFNLDCEKINEESQGFVLRGIWQDIAHYESPVISIYRNRESIDFFNKLNNQQQSSFARLRHIPVVWDAPVEPFKFNPQAEKDSQMPRYFVEVRAIFKDGLFVVEEMLSEPTLKIPKFIKVSKKEQDKSVEKTAQKAELAAT